MDESKRMGIDVLGPEVNESFKNFMVNKKGQIRFGLAAIKGVGAAAVENIIKERVENGQYSNVYDFVERVNLSSVNKRVLDALIFSGATDNIGKYKRIRYIENTNEGIPFIDVLLKYGNKMQQGADANQNSLFGGDSAVEVQKPEPPIVKDEWSQLAKLNKEKELIGIYLSAHPLDSDKHVISAVCNTKLSNLVEINKLKGKDIKIAGMITNVEHRTTKAGKPWGNITIEDFSDSFKIPFFSKQYLQFKQFFEIGYKLYIIGRAESRYNSPNEFEFRVKKINMLSDMSVKSIAIKLPIERLTEEFVEEFATLSKENKGESNLQFLIFEPSSRIWIQMQSKNNRIEVNEKVLNYIKDEQQLEYKMF